MEKKAGKMVWFDLTVDHAEEIRDFYSDVVGWKFEPVPQKGYDDYNMKDEDGEVVTGICHRKEGNSKLPPQWLIYVTVKDLDHSLKRCNQLGGKLIDGPRNYGKQQYAIIQDPAGAYMALFEERS